MTSPAERIPTKDEQIDELKMAVEFWQAENLRRSLQKIVLSNAVEDLRDRFQRLAATPAQNVTGYEIPFLVTADSVARQLTALLESEALA